MNGEINNTMVQENRQDLWCSSCENEDTDICKKCVFAGCPTKYKTKRPINLSRRYNNEYFYFAVTLCKCGKYYSCVVKVAQSDNILSKLAIKNIVSANICPTRKCAADLVTHWNNSYKANGTYMFDNPAF